MRIHITVPDEHVGKVIGDLNSRRAQINESTTQDASDTGRASQSTQNVIDAFVPLSETFQYTTPTPFDDTRARRVHIGILTLRSGA